MLIRAHEFQQPVNIVNIQLILVHTLQTELSGPLQIIILSQLLGLLDGVRWRHGVALLSVRNFNIAFFTLVKSVCSSSKCFSEINNILKIIKRSTII